MNRDATCRLDGSVPACGALAESVRRAVSQQSPQESLPTAIDVAVAYGRCDHASITMVGPNRAMETVAASGERTVKADRLQYDLEQGPCLDAARSENIVRVNDLAAEIRWPLWSPLAADLGMGAILAMPLYTDVPLGTLNLYSENPREFDGTDLEAAKVVAAHTSVILDHTRVHRNMSQAVKSRTMIGQAQGILMARHRITADKAFAVLRRYSQTTNTRLAVIAEELINTGHLPDLTIATGDHPG